MISEKIMGKMEEVIEGCMGDSEAYCVTKCPMHTDAKGYINLIGEGKGQEALNLIREKLFLPGTLGRICAHPCETDCKRGELNAPMAIATLKRYAADNFDSEELWDLTKEEANGRKVAIIGAGPAGAQAALDLVKKGFEVVVFDKHEVFGGMMRVGIPEYRLPRNVIDKEYSYLEKLGVEFKMGVKVGKDVNFEDLKKDYDAVVVAIGRQQGRVDANITNHDAEGVFHAVEFLEDVSLTRTFKKAGKKVVVVGGGDVAMDCARSAMRLEQVESVEVICLEGTLDTMASTQHEVHGALAEGIVIHPGWGSSLIEVNADDRVKNFKTKKCTSLFDENGRFAPKYSDEMMDLECDTIIYAIGQGVDHSFDPNNSLERNHNQTIKNDFITGQSSVDNVFIAGDVSGTGFLVIEAMAEGRRAAKSIERFIAKTDMAADRINEMSYKTKLETEIPENVVEVPRVSTPELDPKERVKGFMEVDLGFDQTLAEKESKRCLECECKLCMKNCVMLNDFGEHPKGIFESCIAKGEMPDKLVYSCNMCSQCTIACPKDYKMQDVFMESRVMKVNENHGKSPMKGHGAIEVHQYLGYSNFFNTANKAPKGKKTKRVFIPGCSLPSYNPKAVGNILEYLQEKYDGEVGSILKCCGKPTKALGQIEKFKERYASVQKAIDEVGAEEIIVACQSCYGMFSTNSPNQTVRSVWEILPELGLPEHAKGIGKDSDVTFGIHDSCSTRYNKEIQDGIRWILDEMGYKTEEPEHTRENTRCCGFGGMVVPANPEVAHAVMKKRVAEFKTDHLVSYCAACRESMETAGKDSVHILDLVFGERYTKASATKRSQGPVTQWMNRYKSKSELNKRK